MSRASNSDLRRAPAPARRGEGASFHHKHSLGQNFLSDEAILNALVDDAGVGENDHILEIGPGAGDMTRILARRCASVTAIELDETLMPFLRVLQAEHPHVHIVQGDALRVNIPELMRDKPCFHVVANIPYYLTTDLLTLLLGSGMPLRSVNVMVQKEAAGRVLARPSTPEYGMLAVRAQYYTTPRIARIVEAACFTPPPKVDSAFVCMPWRDAPAVSVRDEKLFFRVAAAAFTLRRKTLCNNLMPAFGLSRAQAEGWIARAGIRPDARGEALSLAEFARLADTREMP